ncbi:hypothetical protein [Candidatus Accumulibacter contiguus]|uniref:hypothetical protein n=1 Tax=Candidatus Accumulibacter contiguus TaxID=2954381 RepID=UPI002FC2CF7C
MRVFNTSGRSPEFDIRRTGRDLDQIRDDEIIPGLQRKCGGSLLEGIQSLKSRLLLTTVETAR